MMPCPAAPAPSIDAIRLELTRAGYLVGAATGAIECDVRLHDDPVRGVVVSWQTAARLRARNPAAHRLVREAVHLALLTVLTGAGYAAVPDRDTGEILVTCPEGDLARSAA
ncbi:hypothetical protein Ssi03_02610 [Sphaerisporangium siamense]|uniref:Uncharacterized protein n=1 Tax=Sphaerisporangium siamense TaxID=795645 RepID=A0A7W7DBI8_9ACTN|nr:hypothetical protein [Sphaerisporangium siamense]MBB4703802.1 hypothetical protein [Sphaerisporangium siamense]GII82271.1 hypothetical protein Ssi03_02610 [Sphaerisporangium siamense]